MTKKRPLQARVSCLRIKSAMDLNRLLQTVVNMLLRKGVNWGVKKGVDMASRQGGTDRPSVPRGPDQSRAGRDLAKRARDMAKLSRRLGR